MRRAFLQHLIDWWGALATLAMSWFTPVRRLVALSELDPHWLPDPPERGEGARWGIGIGFLCPVHQDHRVWLYFRAPLDGGAHVQDVRLHNIENFDLHNGDPFDEITVTDLANDTTPLTSVCGARFWIVGGAAMFSLPQR